MFYECLMFYWLVNILIPRYWIQFITDFGIHLGLLRHWIFTPLGPVSSIIKWNGFPDGMSGEKSIVAFLKRVSGLIFFIAGYDYKFYKIEAKFQNWGFDLNYTNDTQIVWTTWSVRIVRFRMWNGIFDDKIGSGKIDSWMNVVGECQSETWRDFPSKGLICIVYYCSYLEYNVNVKIHLQANSVLKV